ncbi:MAG: hypothetical protein JNN15_17960 [Blastocatellia bacterium]|nr:hypothetical protein [Blastocatellia bacterium]
MKTCPVCRNAFDENLSVCPYDGQPLDDTSLNSIVGTTLDGQYQIEALIGRGGMGAVYRATHLLLGEKVAIKKVLQDKRYKNR